MDRSQYSKEGLYIMKNKEDRMAFAIMPFSETPTRNTDDLSIFYDEAIRKPIETSEVLEGRWRVRRSGDAFDITDQVIVDLYHADVVLCDLSGLSPNPNVMYELGVRLSISLSPVVLFREEHPENRRVFDISAFHTFSYSPFRYSRLSEYIVEKLRKYEAREEIFKSPVLTALSMSPRVLRELNRGQAFRATEALQVSLRSMLRCVLAEIRLVGKEVFSDETTEDDIIKELAAEGNKLDCLDWASFDLAINSLPGGDAYLTDTPLKGLLKPDIERVLNTWIMEYVYEYIASNWAAKGKNPVDCITFWVWETMLLIRALQVVKAYVADFSLPEFPEGSRQELIAIMETSWLVKRQGNSAVLSPY